MSNIVLKLLEGLSGSTNQDIFPHDLADLLGYKKTQLREYVKKAREGSIDKPNERLERVAQFAVMLGEANGFESLFPFIGKLSTDDDQKWLKRQVNRLNKLEKQDPTTAGQIHIDEVVKADAPKPAKKKAAKKPKKQVEPENAHQKAAFSGIEYPDFVTLEMREALKVCDQEEVKSTLEQFKKPRGALRVLNAMIAMSREER